jgi:hypothetical protein
MNMFEQHRSRIGAIYAQFMVVSSKADHARLPRVPTILGRIGPARGNPA